MTTFSQGAAPKPVRARAQRRCNPVPSGFDWHVLALLVCLGASLSVWAQEAPSIPHHETTPGATNPAVTQANVTQTACVSGWTKTVRPPSSYTSKLKATQIHMQHLPGTARDYHEDHLVPLCVGGAPRDTENLWPQPLQGKWTAAVKDQLESSVCRAVCRGDMTLQEGQAVFLAPDWTKEYERFFGL